ELMLTLSDRATRQQSQSNHAHCCNVEEVTRIHCVTPWIDCLFMHESDRIIVNRSDDDLSFCLSLMPANATFFRVHGAGVDASRCRLGHLQAMPLCRTAKVPALSTRSLCLS